MKKKILIILIVLTILISGAFVYLKILNKNDKTDKKGNIVYSDYALDENIIVENDLTIEFGKIKYLSDYISVIEGTLNDVEIEYNDLGEVKVNFSYKNKLFNNYRYITINVVDTTKPYVSVPSYKSVVVNSSDDFINDFFCADNHDKIAKRYLEGDYNLGEIGEYNVKYVAEDISGNKAEKNMTINVVEKINSSSSSNNNSRVDYIAYQDLYNKYKNENTKIGIDISRWQGDVDFDKLKENNVEFIMIRLGGQDGFDGEYYLDSKFERNIKEATSKGFDIGIYFYSYAYTNEEAIKQAKYVLENIKGYDVKLPIVFDWEVWSKFNKLGISLFDITKVQDTFLDYVESKGYKASRYSSKNNLINAWQDSSHLTWLAHYTENTNYEGEYFMWQRCDTGKVPGINGAVDVDVLYLDKYEI